MEGVGSWVLYAVVLQIFETWVRKFEEPAGSTIKRSWMAIKLIKNEENMFQSVRLSRDLFMFFYVSTATVDAEFEANWSSPKAKLDWWVLIFKQQF